jgi:hypothetical protein
MGGAYTDHVKSILLACEQGEVIGRIKDVRVFETMRLMEGRYQEAVGVWEEADGLIIVKRTQLRSHDAFAGTVLHELSHALSGAPDVSFAFEEQLTQELGRVVARRLTQAVENNELTRQSTDSRGRSP